MLIKALSFSVFFFTIFCQLSVTAAELSIENEQQLQSETEPVTNTIDNLVKQNKLTISLQVNQKEKQIVGQALILAIEVATDRWFARGSQVKDFNLKNVVMQANNIITINGSKRIDGQTWATQTHEITLYPTIAGTYHLPEIKLDVSVNTENDGIISGELTSQATSFTIDLPEDLVGIKHFIVSSNVELKIEGKFDEDKDYAVGEAVTQTITITASDTPAMMIPEMSFSTIDMLDGVSIYQKPAQVFDRSNRGSLIGSRVESFTYIFEQAGSYELEEKIIYWWNSQSNELEQLVLPAASWSVSGGGFSQASQSLMGFKYVKLNFVTLLIVVIVLLLLIVSYFLFIKRHRIITFYYKITKYEQRQVSKRFLVSIESKEYLKATQYLYQYTLLLKNQSLLENNELAQKLNQVAYMERTTGKVALIFSPSDAKALIKQITTKLSVNKNHANFPPDENIQLNKPN